MINEIKVLIFILIIGLMGGLIGYSYASYEIDRSEERMNHFLNMTPGRHGGMWS